MIFDRFFKPYAPQNYTIIIPFKSKFKAKKNKWNWIITGGFQAND